MTKKKIFKMLFIIMAINTTLFALSEKKKNVVVLKSQLKIPTISEKHNFYISPKDKIKYTDKGNILVLSRKHCCIYRFNSKGQYRGSFLRKGKGPNEISYPQYFTPLSNDRIIIQDNDKFIFYETKKELFSELSRLTILNSYIGDIEEYNKERIFVLNAFPIAKGIKGNDLGKLIHIYDSQSKKNIQNFFEIPASIGNRNSNELRSEYGSGDILYYDNLLFLIYNQPGSIFIFKTDGTLHKQISTKFHFVKYNSADVKEINHDGFITIRMNYANTCKMNLIVNNKKLYLITRINYGNHDEPIYRYYISNLNYREGKFVNHLTVETSGIDISKSEFKCFNQKNITFLDEDFIYSFSMH